MSSSTLPSSYVEQVVQINHRTTFIPISFMAPEYTETADPFWVKVRVPEHWTAYQRVKIKCSAEADEPDEVWVKSEKKTEEKGGKAKYQQISSTEEETDLVDDWWYNPEKAYPRLPRPEKIDLVIKHQVREYA